MELQADNSRICLCQWYDYPERSGSYGSGGWSRHAKHRPQPKLVERVAKVTFNGKSVQIGGVRKLKVNLFDLIECKVIRSDYPKIKLPAWLSEPLKCQLAAKEWEGRHEQK